MSTNVYNIVWADDEIDELLDDEYLDELKEQGFNVVGMAHNGHELESCLEQPDCVDAVIVDANFNESQNESGNERDISGLVFARSLYNHKLNQQIPFFLFTARNDELLKEKYEDNIKDFINDFPRHQRWFHKGDEEEMSAMFEAIKRKVDEMHTPQFCIRNRYKVELDAAKQLDDEAYKFVYDFLIREYNDDFEGLGDPFNPVRKIIETIFGRCEKLGLIPPISDDMNGSADYFVYKTYSPYNKAVNKRVKQYEMLGKDPIMPNPIASALKNIVNIVQDGSHRKEGCEVDKYYNRTKDALLLRAVVYILIDVIKWFATTAQEHPDDEINAITLWGKVD